MLLHSCNNKNIYINIKVQDTYNGKKWFNSITLNSFKNSINYVNNENELGQVLSSSAFPFSEQEQKFKKFLSYLFKPLEIEQINNNYKTISQKLIFMNSISASFFKFAILLNNKIKLNNSIKIRIWI